MTTERNNVRPMRGGAPAQQQMMPHDHEAEQFVLGAVLLTNEVLAQLREVFPSAEVFFSPAHREVYEAMCRLHDHDDPIDEITLGHDLKSRGKMESVGGFNYILELSERAVVTSNALVHADIVFEQYRIRLIAQAAMDFAHAPSAEAAQTLHEQSRAALEMAGAARRTVSTGVLAQQVLAMLDEADQEPDRSHLIPTYTRLDRRLVGMEPGLNTVVAARPSCGKSTFCVQTALRNAWHGRASAVFSLEMSPLRMAQRIACSIAGVDSRKLIKDRGRRFTEEEWTRVAGALAEMQRLPLHWPEAGRRMALADIAARTERLVGEHGVELVVIDQLKLVGGVRGRNAAEEQAQRSMGLADIAQRLGIVVLVAAQINREGNDKPMLHHLEGSDQIAQDADTVLILHAPAPDETDQRDSVEVRVAKNRDGEPYETEISWEPGLYRLDYPTFHETLAQPGLNYGGT